MKHNEITRKKAKKSSVIHQRTRGNRAVTVTHSNGFYAVETAVSGRVRWLVTFSHLSKALARAKDALEED
jgi:hypothetical protein